MAEQQTDVYEYTLNILSVKMNVKFPCKMKLEHNGTGLTSQALSNEGQKFIFNQEVTLKEDSDKQFFEVSVNLITQKGGKYIAGILKIFQSELIRSEGQRIVIPLTKCLDSQAYCQVRIDQVTTSKQFKRNQPQMYKSRVYLQSGDHQFNSGHKIKSNYLGGQTKSQLQFPINNKKVRPQWEEIKSRHNAAQSYYNRNMNRSPAKSPHRLRNPYQGRQDLHIRPQVTLGRHQHGSQPFEMENKDKFIEAEVYKEGYNKLKEKYKKQAQNAKNQLNKRISLQSAQNNLKLQIMRLRLRGEQQEKALTQKNIKIKQLHTQISSYQKKQLDLGYLREQINNKDHSLRILQENIRTITKDNQQLKALNHQRTVSQQQKTKQLKKQLQLFRQKAQAKQNQLQRQLKSKVQALYLKQADLQSKNQLLNREKKTVEQLQKQSQNRTIQFERMMQQQKTLSRNKFDDLKLKIQKLQKNIAINQNQKNQLQNQLDKLKTQQVKVQYQNRVLIQEIDSLKTQLSAMKSYKDKYSELFRDHKLLIDDKNHLQKQLERALQSKELSTTQLNKQHIEQVQYFRKSNKQLDQKQRNYSNRIVQLQGLLDASKSAQQKLKRTLQSTNTQLNQLRDRQKLLRKTLKTKQQQNLTFQNQLSSLKQKNKSTQHFYKHQLDKYKEQLEKIKSQYQNQNLKNIQLNQQNSQLSIELGKIKVKLQFTQEKVQKDIIDMKDKKQQIQNIIKDYQGQLALLNQTIQNLRNNQKQLIGKMQKQEIQGLKSQERIQRMTKQIKVLEQKHTFAQNLLKNRQSESTVLQTGKKDLEMRSYKLQEQISAIRVEQSQLQAEKNKNQKMIELMQQDNTKLRKENQRLKQSLQQKQKNIEQILAELKKVREQLTKTDMKLTNITKDFERFKQSTMQGLNSTFSQILPQRKQKEQNQTSRKNISQLMHTNVPIISPGEINNLILNYSKQTKIALSKLTQQNRQLIRENQKLQQELTGNINKGQTSQYQYSKQIQDLQAQLSAVYAQKDQQAIKFDHILKDLNTKIRQKDRQINDLNVQLDDLNFTLNSNRVQYDNQMDQYNKKNISLKNKILELQEKIQFFNMNIMNMEEKIHDQEMECEGVKGAFRGEKENGLRKDRIIIQLQERRDQLQQQIQQGKRQRKDLLQKNSTLELLLNTQRQQVQKTRQLLQDEQQKSMQLKTFIGSLMKQKQAIIKTQLEKSQQVINLQGNILELTRDRDILIEDNKQYLKQIQQAKQNIKKVNALTKQLQAKIVDERNKNQKLSEKIKQREKEIINKQESIEKLQAKCNRLNERGQKQGIQLRQQLQAKTQQLLNLTKQHSEKIFQFDKEKHAFENTINQLRGQLINMQEQIFNLKHSHETRIDQINTLNAEISQYRSKIQNLQIFNKQLNQEIRQRQQTAFQLSGKLYGLQSKLQSKQIQKNQRIAALDNDWICKYEGMCEQYEQRIQLVQKQRDYYKQRMQGDEEELKKVVNEKNMTQIEDGKIKGILQQKIRQLEEDRLMIISQKNVQIQKISQQNKIQFETLKTRQSQSRKLLHELQITKGTVSKLELKNKEMDDKIKNITRVYQAEIEGLKKKDSVQKHFKESVSTMIWNAQRQVRRIIQSFIKRTMEACQDSRNSHKIIEVMKGFQQNVAEAMKINLDDIR